MIHEIRYAFNELLQENVWMDAETRLVAEDKANSMNERIGYPEYITNSTRLESEYQKVSRNALQEIRNCSQLDSSRTDNSTFFSLFDWTDFGA